MLLIHCPYCQKERPEIEFSYAGQAHLIRPSDPSNVSHEEWAEYLFVRENKRGTHAERWVHTHGCARYFNAMRDTVTDKFLATYRVDETPPDMTSGKET